ncbi:hypothetical protein J7E99_19885 [Streptomyces sp. ISL-44]|uniref:DUF6585 family protein n=1 Tax=Streptomyces sp. ISL-44 TaxID=2819184 RepID=UPI001BE60FFF|nr:DUF6585 family protein [Streptomyces sp. ISL-44]MBT2542905.1 hypothetical protein [Streptomyces sp. ISL-44]
MTVPTSPSRAVDALAVRHRLGSLEHTFRPESEVGVQEKYRVWFIVGSLVAIAALLGSGVLLWVKVHWGVALFPLWIGVLAAGAVANSPLFRKGLAARRLHLYEHGLVVNTTGSGLFTVRWERAVLYQETVQEVIDYKGTQTPVGRSHASVLVAPGGEKARITDVYAGSPTWAPLIAEAVARAQVEKVWKLVREGGTVDFGPFKLSGAGVTSASGEMLPWRDVSEVAVRGGMVCVWRAGQTKAWQAPQAQQVPNLLVFLTIVDNLRRR